jgi:hypothetical protein
LWEGTSVAFEGKQMTIYRTRDRDPQEHRWVRERPKRRVVPEVHRAQIERRFAPRKLEIGIDCFEVNPSKSVGVRFHTAHAAD